MDYLTAAKTFVIDNAVLLGGVAAVLAIIAFIWAIVTKPFRSKPKVELSDEAVKKIAPRSTPDGPQLTVIEFIRIRREMKSDLEAELVAPHQSDKAQLVARINELESQIASPEKALAEAQKRIAALEARLERMGNQIGGDRLVEARAALERLDYSVADGIFAEIEARNELAVQETARAAFGRGEIAEARVDWADAAAHYARAAGLAPGFDTLFKAREFAWRAGDYRAALGFGETLVKTARADGTQKHLSRALNAHATTLSAVGKYAEAEALFREALAIAAKTIGTAHPDYAATLNNLAGVVRAQGRSGEAEALFREVLAIDAKTIGTAHPGYAIDLNNLAGVVKDLGRSGEAEAIYREVLAIDAKTIGTVHPGYAIDLNNLAGVVRAQGRSGEAEPLYREALAIGAKTIGTAHPDYATRLGNFALLLEDTGRRAEAGPLFEQALRILEAALGPDHPDTQKLWAYLDDFRNDAG